MSSLNTSETLKPFLKINDNSSSFAMSKPDTSQQILSDLDLPPSNTQYIKRYQHQSSLFGITFQSSSSPLTLALSTKNISNHNTSNILFKNNLNLLGSFGFSFARSGPPAARPRPRRYTPRTGSLSRPMTGHTPQKLPLFLKRNLLHHRIVHPSFSARARL